MGHRRWLRRAISRDWVLFTVGVEGFFALLLAFITPPLAGLDETAHFLRAASIASGHFATQTSVNSAGGPVDDSVNAFSAIVRSHIGPLAPPYPKWVLKKAWSLRRVGVEHYQPFSNTAIYPPIAYLPEAVGIALASLSGLPTLLWLYIARVINVVCSLGVLLWGAFRRPGLAPLLIGFYGVPTVLFQTSVLSADAVLIWSTIAVLVTLCVIQSAEKLTAVDHAVLMAAQVTVCLSKVAYLPIAVLPSLFAFIYSSDRGTKVKLCLGFLCTMGLWLGWALYVHDKVYSIRPNVDVDAIRQGRLIIFHPIFAAGVISSSIMWEAPFQFLGMFRQLGNSGIRFGYILWIVSIPLFLSLVRIDRTWSRRNVAAAGLTAAVLLCVVALIYSLLYLQFTQVGAAKVDGVQPRYFVPLLLLALGVQPLSSVVTGKRRAIIGLSLASCLATSLLVINTYWLAGGAT